MRNHFYSLISSHNIKTRKYKTHSIIYCCSFHTWFDIGFDHPITFLCFVSYKSHCHHHSIESIQKSFRLNRLTSLDLPYRARIFPTYNLSSVPVSTCTQGYCYNSHPAVYLPNDENTSPVSVFASVFASLLKYLLNSISSIGQAPTFPILKKKHISYFEEETYFLF